MQVTDQDLDVWQNTPACVPDALRHYYYEYLSSTAEAAEVVLKPFVELASCSLMINPSTQTCSYLYELRLTPI